MIGWNWTTKSPRPPLQLPINEYLQIMDMTEQFKHFWLLVVDVWKTGVFGIDIGAILVALTIFFVFLLLRGLITRFIIGALKLKVSKTRTLVDDELLIALEEPIRLVPIILGAFFALQFLSLDDRVQDLADKLVRSLITGAIFWALYRAAEPLSSLLGKLEKLFNAAMLDWLVKAIKVLFAFIGFAAVLEIWGIQVGPILAGLGLFGVAVALGAQDLFKNLIAGILIIAERRFNIGDWIRVENIVEGTRSEEHTSELQSHHDLVCRLLLEKKKTMNRRNNINKIHNQDI